MVVTIKKIMFSGDEPQKEPSFMDKLAKRLGIGTPKAEEVFCEVSTNEVNKVNRTTKYVKDDMKYTISAIKRNEQKAEELKEDLANAVKDKNKATIKFIKKQIYTNKLVLDYSKNELKTFEAILKENE